MDRSAQALTKLLCRDWIRDISPEGREQLERTLRFQFQEGVIAAEKAVIACHCQDETAKTNAQKIYYTQGVHAAVKAIRALQSE